MNDAVRIAGAAIALTCSWGSAQPFVTFNTARPGQFIDISIDRPSLGLTDDGVSERILFTRPNLVLQQGFIRVGNNGGVGFFGTANREDAENLPPDNAPLPSGDAFGGDQAMLPFWDDPGADIGGVYYLELADRVVVQWDLNFKPSTLLGPERPFRGSWQLQIFDNSMITGNAFAQFLYRDIEDVPALGGAIATIGYQDGGRGFNTVQYSFNQAGAVGNGTVITWELSPIPAPGTIVLGVVALAFQRRRRA